VFVFKVMLNCPRIPIKF